MPAKKKAKGSWKRKAAIGVVVAGVGAAGFMYQRHATRKKEAIRVSRQKILGSGLKVDFMSWGPVCRIYKFDPMHAKTRSFIESVDGFCTREKLSLKRFFLTAEQNEISEGQIGALQTANSVYRRQIGGFELTAKAKKGKERRFALSQIKKLNSKIEGNNRIKTVIEFCLKHKAFVSKMKGTRGSLSEVRALPDKPKR